MTDTSEYHSHLQTIYEVAMIDLQHNINNNNININNIINNIININITLILIFFRININKKLEKTKIRYRVEKKPLQTNWLCIGFNNLFIAYKLND